MKHIIYKLCTLISMLWVSTSASAYDFEVDGFYYEVNIEKMTATLVAGDSKYVGDITVPATVSYKGRSFNVTAINGAFYENTELSCITIPKSVTYIGDNTFRGCSSLKTIDGIENISEIGAYCFAGCKDLKSMTLSPELKVIRESTFADCAGLTKIAIPNQVISIDNAAFKNCTSLSAITLPTSIAILSSDLFKGCVSLREIVIPSRVTNIEDGAFSNCKALDSIEIPENVLTIGNDVFNRCSNLSSLVLSDSSMPLYVGTAGKESPLFIDCPLSSVYIGRDLTYPRDPSTYGITYYYSPFCGSALQNVQIGQSVTTLYYYLFEKCKNIKEISLPSNLMTINYGVFRGCSSISKLVVDEGNEELLFSTDELNPIDEGILFMNDCPLKEVYLGRNIIGKGITSRVGYSLLYLQTELETITIGDFVSDISCLLYNDSGSITTSLSRYSNLKSLQIGQALSFVPDLSDNTKIKSFSLTSTTPKSAIGFSNRQYMDLCPNIPIGSLEKYANAPIWKNFWSYNECDDLLTIFEVDGILYRIIKDKYLEVVKKSSEYAGVINIPANVEYNGNTYEVSSLGQAFKGCAMLTSITIPATVHSLANDCFRGCSQLENVIFYCDLEEISSGAFQNCVSLSTIKLPETIKFIRGNAFSGCSLLESFTCPDLLIFIGESAFENCTSLKSIALNNVATISNSTFSGCTDLMKVEFNTNISVIPQSCFSRCSNLEYIQPLNSVVKIESYAFDECKHIQEISLPNIISISDNAFKNCTGLISILLGNGLEEIGERAFSNCAMLESVTIPGGVKSFGASLFSGCTSLRELIFEDSDKPMSFSTGSYKNESSVKTIEIDGRTVAYKVQYYNAFFNGLPIEKLYIGRNLSDSPRYTISGDGGVDYYLISTYDTPFSNLPKLKELVIGEHVDIVGPNEAFIYEVGLSVTPGSFKKCGSLEKVTVLNNNPPTGAEFSNRAYSRATLFIPDNSVSIYQEADGWREFEKILEESDAGIDNTSVTDSHSTFSVSPDGITYEGDSIAQICVYGIDGKLYYSLLVRPMQSISLPRGIYVVRVKDKSIMIRI